MSKPDALQSIADAARTNVQCKSVSTVSKPYSLIPFDFTLCDAETYED